MKKTISIFALSLLSLGLFASCSNSSISNPSSQTATNNANSTNADEGTTGSSVDSDKTDIPDGLDENVNTLTITCSEGTQNAYSIEDNVLTFSNMTANSIYSISGEFSGQIQVDVGDDYEFELELCGVKIYSSSLNPILILSGDKVTLSSKKGTQNYIYDTREAISDEDETAYSGAIYAKCDLELSGKGELVVISSNNNGIHTKDDLKVKNVTLSVTCEDNALKGNDSVSIQSGVLTLISKSGDGIKTKNTDISSKGNQRGTISISGGTTTIYAACDGLDASYDVEISSEAILNIYTDRYSPYSEESEETSSQRYLKVTNNAYNYSIKYSNESQESVFVNATYSSSTSFGRNQFYYYTFDTKSSYPYVEVYIYSQSQAQSQETSYVYKTDKMSWNDAYDTLVLESRGSSYSYNWSNYQMTTGNRPGEGGSEGPGGGGMNDGNSEKQDKSTKGIKAGNEIHVSGGTLNINSYDDSLHANSGETLENSETSTGNILLTGGNMTLYSKDDAIHADGTLTIKESPTINITNCYEGLEGEFISILGGDIDIVSSDDGVNATTTSGTGITFEGGDVFVYAGGDGLDSNSKTSYQGILFNGGEVKIVSTSGGDSSIDTENGYTYRSGKVLALCPSNGMGNESMNCQNFSSIGTKKNMNLTANQTLTVKVDEEELTSLLMPCALSALILYLGSSNATISAS